MTILRTTLGFVFAASLLWGQADANRGSIAGSVSDANQAAIPNAEVKVRNAETGFAREVRTNEAGMYRLAALDPGTYEVTAASPGLATTVIQGLVVNVGSTVTANITLQVQAVMTTVDVGESLIALETSSQSSVVNSTAITNLPINGRRFQDFAVLAPTVQVEGLRSQLSFAGQRGIYSNVMLDGADYNQPFFGGIRGGERSNSIITVPQSAVQEFQLVTTGYNAEYGRSTGGIMNTITKTGGNEVHGQAFYQNRNRTFAQQSPIPLRRLGQIVEVTPSETLQQWGGGIGGPIKKDKLFWFAAYEQQYADTPRNVVFDQLSGRVATPATAEAYNYYRSLEQPFEQTNKATAFTGRMDYQANAGHRLTTRFNFSDSSEVNALSVGGALNPFTNLAVSNEGTEKDRIYNGTIQYTHLISARVLNDFRFTGSYEIRPRLANAEVPLVTNTIGQFGTRNFMPNSQDDYRWQFTDSLSRSSGSHTTKFGVDYSYLTTGQTFGFHQFGTWNVGGTNIDQILDIMSSAGSIPNRFDSTTVTYSRQIGNLLAAYNAQQFAAFVQDNWRVSPKLTLDFGLRWEAQFNPSPTANNSSVVDRVSGFRFPIGMTVDPTKIPDTLNQIMPRFGFAWSPVTSGHRTVVRGHTGLFYGATPLLVFAGPTNNFRQPPGDVAIVVGGAGAVLTPYQAFLQAGVDLNQMPIDKLAVIPLETVQRAAALALGGAAADPFRGANLIPAAPDFRNPRSFQAGLGIDTEIVRNFIAGVQLNYVNAVNLLRNRDYNVPGPVVVPADAAQRPRFGLVTGILPTRTRPISTLGSIWGRESSARSMYRAMTLQAQYRVKNFQFQAFYTLSDNFSDDDNERDATGTNYVNSFNLRDEYNYSNIDSHHQFAGNAVVTLPWGFEAAGIFRYRSGLPFTARTGADENQDNVFNDRPFSAAGVPFERNSYRNRGVIYNDLRLSKSFKMGERYRVQLSSEFFNLFNVENVVFGTNSFIYGAGLMPNGQTAPVDSRFMLFNATDGRISNQNSQVGSPLQIQLALRFFF